MTDPVGDSGFGRDKTRVSIPTVPPTSEPRTRAFLNAVKEALEVSLGKRGPLADRAVTFRDLSETGALLLTGGVGGGGGTIPIPGGGGTDPYLPPPVPTGLTATGAFSNIILTWDPLPGNRVAYVEVWSNDTDDLGTAVKIGATVATVYSDYIGLSAAGVTRYYWIRAANYSDPPLFSAFNDTAGTPGSTAPDPSYLLELLTGEITESQLYAALNARIDKIEVNETAISTEQTVRQDADEALAAQISLISAGVNTTFDAYQVWNFDQSAEDWTATNATVAWNSGWLAYTSPSGTVELRSPTISPAANGSAYQVVRFKVKRTAGSTWDVDFRWRVGGTWYTKAVSDPSIDIGDSATIVLDMSSEADWNGASIAQVGLDVDSSGGDEIQIDWFGVGRDGPAASTAALQKESLTRATADEALALDITTLQSSVDDNTAAIQTEAQTRATVDGHLSALYTVRVQLTQNGRTVMGGFGISGTSNGTAGATIDFGVQANRFWIAPPEGSTGVSDILPFVVQTTDVTVDGVLIPRGVYMDGAYINNLAALVARIGEATIDNAKIASLDAAKLTVGLGIVGGDLRSANYVNGSAGWILSPNGYAEFGAAAIRGQLVADQIDTRGLTIKDMSGNVILSASENLSWNRLKDIPATVGAVPEVIIYASSDFFKVDSAGQPANASIVLTAELRGGLTGTVVWTSTAGYNGSFPNSNSFTVNAANQTADAVSYTATLTAQSGVYTDVYTLVRLRDGATAVTAVLSNEAHTVPALSDGTVTSLAGASTTMSVFVGATNDSANWTYSVTPSSGVTITTSAGGRTVTVNGMSADTAFVDITASKSGFPSVSKRFSLTKSKQGTVGSVGPPGPSGTDGSRGTVHVTRAISGSVWSNTEANTAIAVAGYGVPQERDMVTLYNTAAAYSEQRFWSGGSWLTISLYLSGNAFIDGTIAGNKITAGSIVANRIQVGTLTATQLQTNSISRAAVATRNDTSPMSGGGVGDLTLTFSQVQLNTLLDGDWSGSYFIHVVMGQILILPGASPATVFGWVFSNDPQNAGVPYDENNPLRSPSTCGWYRTTPFSTNVFIPVNYTRMFFATQGGNYSFDTRIRLVCYQDNGALAPINGYYIRHHTAVYRMIR